MSKWKGSGVIASGDYHVVKFVGKTKSGQAVTIQLNKALNMGDIDWAFKEKDDVVAQIVFTGVYSNTDAMSASNDEPWTVEVGGASLPSGANAVMLGAGEVLVDSVPVALTRGGSQFKVAREYRRINADGDRGAVEGRVVIEGSEATLTLNALTIINNFASLYTAVVTTT